MQINNNKGLCKKLVELLDFIELHNASYKNTKILTS